MQLGNLYLKTEYTFLSSTCKIEEVVKKASEYGYSALAVTDVNNMYGAVKFYLECEKYHLKPILGAKINYNYNNNIASLLLYAVDFFGYINLIKIVSSATIEPVKYEMLLSYGKGLIGIIPGSENRIYNCLDDNNQYNFAINEYNELSRCFNRLYLGIIKSNEYEQNHYHSVVAAATAANIPMVGLINTEILTEKDDMALEVLHKINKDDKVSTNNHLHTLNEYINEFNDYPDLITNNEDIVRSCNVTLEFDKPAYPKYKDGLDARVYLTELAYKGLKKRLLHTNKNEEAYYDRLNYELNVINKMGYADYFLIVFDFIKYAKKHDIMVGPGRGSGVSSLVSYALGIIDIDPLQYDLIFERFLNVERITMPDIDVDFEDDRRDEVIKYVTKRYGENKVAHIITFSSYGIKNAINDVASVLNLPETRKNQIFKNLEKDLSSKSSLKEIIATNNDLKYLYDNYEDIRNVLDIASIIEGLPKNKSTHASGIIITETNILNYCPVEKTSDNILQTQYSGPYLEKLGLLKMDFLGLHNLTTLKNCVDNIKKHYPKFCLPKDLNDFKTYQLISTGKTNGIFQLENASMKQTIKTIQVNNFDELVQSMALNRPGTMDMIPLYRDIKFGKRKVNYLHPALEPILKETKGIILYQEQILAIARMFAGYTYGKADLLRRAISKKNKDLMLKEKNDFIYGSIKNGYSRNIAENIFSYIEEFANYGFNKSHSVAYSYISYYIAYLKANYPAYFFTTMINDHHGDDEKINQYYKEALSMGVKFYAPNIHVSLYEFIAKENNVLIGLNKIKNLSKTKIEEIIKLRPFSSFEDFVLKTDNILNEQEYEKIIFSNALDLFKLTKKAMITSYKDIIARKKYSHITTLKPIVYTQDEYDYETLLDKELSSLGFNIKYNFFVQYQYLYQKYNLRKLNQFNFSMKNVATVCVIETIREIKTKQNETMAFCTVMDDTTEMEMVIFPKVYKDLNLEIGKIKIIYGEIQRRDNEDNNLQIVARRIEKI